MVSIESGHFLAPGQAKRQGKRLRQPVELLGHLYLVAQALPDVEHELIQRSTKCLEVELGVVRHTSADEEAWRDHPRMGRGRELGTP